MSVKTESTLESVLLIPTLSFLKKKKKRNVLDAKCLCLYVSIAGSRPLASPASSLRGPW